MNAKQMKALAIAKALDAKRKAKELNDKADPYVDTWLTRLMAHLTASEFTPAYIVGLMVGVVVLAIIVLL